MALNHTVRFLLIGIVVALFLAITPPFGYTEPTSPDLTDSINLLAIGSGFQTPVGIVTTNIESDQRLFIVERTGRIWILEDGQKFFSPFLDLSDQISLEGERGLLGMAFDPEYTSNGYFYVNYTTNAPAIYGDTVVSRFSVSDNLNSAIPDSEEVILEVAQIANSHNGGHLAFDLNGNLIIGLGDGGGTGEETRVSQSSQSLLGKMLRINVSGEGLAPNLGCGRVRNYLIPADNPFPQGENGWCPEILSSGWRNPWRYSLDPSTGLMWVGDVGEQKFEEINIIPRTTNVLRSYGWPCFEGVELWLNNCTLPSEALRTDPTEIYARVDDNGTFLGVSVTGGYVYQGDTFPELDNTYFYGDFISGNIWAIDTEDDETNSKLILGSDANISTFGLDSAGELYLADYQSGEILRVMGNQAVSIKMIAPGLTLPDRFGVWKIEVTNLGAEPIAELQFSGNVPEEVLYVDGGVYRNPSVTLTFNNVQPNQTVAQSWRGLLPKEPVVLQNPDYVGTLDQFKYIEIDEGVPSTIITNQIFSVYLPAVR